VGEGRKKGAYVKGGGGDLGGKRRVVWKKGCRGSKGDGGGLPKGA